MRPLAPEAAAEEAARRRTVRRRRALVPWFVGLPYLVHPVGWLGFLANVDNWGGLSWLLGMWGSCLVLLPLAVIGAIWAVRLGERASMRWGIVSAVICLPGFLIGLTLLPSFLASVFGSTASLFAAA
ncbi:hypothetical protein ACFVTX_14090 [Agromyces sp. NPDC058136]|uniref:hypothetical protein n=1 Tax=Agromyces sp. NPDC058136 TaxID=3346354 RepID=UPI0036DF7033